MRLRRLAVRLLVPAVALAATLGLPPSADAQTGPLDRLTSSTLQGWLDRRSAAVEACAGESRAAMARVDVTVRGHAGVSTMDDAQIVVRARTEPRSAAAERCISRAVRGELRRLRYATGRSAVRASRTFEIAARPVRDQPEAPPYARTQVQSAVLAMRARLERCLERAGPGAVVLRVAAQPDGSLALQTASLPPRAGSSVLGCLGEVVARAQLRRGPERRDVVVVRVRGEPDPLDGILGE